jgi:predicted amidohydrolase YtcJ
LVLTLAALERTGALPGDRIEHAAVVPPELASWLRRLGVSVVTQPGFIACRGDDYLRDVDAEDRPHLYPYASLLAAGIRTAPSSDAPFGPVDPWAVVAAAMHRRAASGRQVGAYEAAPAQSVLEGYLSCAHDPGGAPRLVRPGAPADLVLLATPWRECLADPDAERVRRVLKAGRAVHVRA